MGRDTTAVCILGIKVKSPNPEDWDNYYHRDLYREDVYGKYVEPDAMYVIFKKLTKDGPRSWVPDVHPYVALPTMDEQVNFYEFCKEKGYVESWQEFKDIFGIYLLVEISD